MSEKELLNHYGEPKSTSTSAWGKEYTYKIGNKDVRFYVNQKVMSLKDKSLVEWGINKKTY